MQPPAIRQHGSLHPAHAPPACALSLSGRAITMEFLRANAQPARIGTLTVSPSAYRNFRNVASPLAHHYCPKRKVMGLERRLTTILSADIAGFTRLMEADEASTLAEMKLRHTLLVEPLLANGGGRLVKLLGDGFLAEFASVVNAVHFAIDLQSATESRNAGRDDQMLMQFRIGINLSDIIADQSDVYGDGVNVAARLEALAEPGGICISDSVYQHVRRHLSCEFQDLGKRHLRNISEDVHVYRVTGGMPPQSRKSAAKRQQAAIAVLPFVNMSGDPEQEYFSDGITEDIITDLSKISSLFVAARNTSFTLKGKALDVQQAAAHLGVQYVLEGSVRKSGNRVRITAQLIDGRSGGHVWAERYDRNLADIFELQDEISRAIVAALKLKLLPGENETLAQRPTENVEAYRYYLMGRDFFNRGHTKRLLRLARQIFSKALSIDPNYALAHAGLADCNSHLLDAGDTSISVDDIFAQSERALSLDPSLAEAHASRGLALYIAGRYQEADASFMRALHFKPDLYEAHLFYGRNCLNRQDFEKAAQLFGRAAEIRTEDFRSSGLQAMCYQSLGLKADAEAAARRALARAEAAVAARPDDADALAFGAGLLAQLGEAERTRDWAERAAIMEPDDQIMHYNLACAYAVLGEVELALDRLEWAMRGGTLKSLVEYMLNDSDFDGLRQHPRYKALVKEIAQ
jgi:adenylate cyclase